MDYKQGRELCFKVIDMAQSLGVQQCDVILQRGKSLALNAQGGRIDKTKVSSAQVLGIRVIQDQKIGIAASEYQGGLDLFAREGPALRLERRALEVGRHVRDEIVGLRLVLRSPHLLEELSLRDQPAGASGQRAH